MAACQLQQAHLAHIAGHLPTYLPSLRSPEVPAAGGGGGLKENARGGGNAGGSQGGGEGGTKKQRAPAPRRWGGWRSHPAPSSLPHLGCRLRPLRLDTPTAPVPHPPLHPPTPSRYIAADELASVSSYMRGRLTADKCNAALDELAGLAEARWGLVARRATQPGRSVRTRGARRIEWPACERVLASSGPPASGFWQPTAQPLSPQRLPCRQTRPWWRRRGATAPPAPTRSTPCGSPSTWRCARRRCLGCRCCVWPLLPPLLLLPLLLSPAGSCLPRPHPRSPPCLDDPSPLVRPAAPQTHEQLKGRSWVLEADLKAGAAVRLDKTGKTLLTLLRHLGRLQEVRLQADGATHLVYVLLE